MVRKFLFILKSRSNNWIFFLLLHCFSSHLYCLLMPLHLIIQFSSNLFVAILLLFLLLHKCIFFRLNSASLFHRRGAIHHDSCIGSWPILYLGRPIQYSMNIKSAHEVHLFIRKARPIYFIQNPKERKYFFFH